jgi:ribosome biogenesis GTPase / thiamine phosphate phosphatase
VSSIDVEAYEDEWEDDDYVPRPGGRRGEQPRGDEHPVGRVVGLHKGWADVVIDGVEVEAVYGGAMRGEQIVVGDRVRVRPPRRDTDTARIVDRLERDTFLMRTADDAVEEERVVAANVDVVVIVLATQSPEVGARFADRVLVAAEYGGLEAALCLNKIDLADRGEHVEVLDRYAALGYPTVRTSATTGEGLDELRGLLAERWSVLSGHSGVGKSSLFNLLVPGASREVGELGRLGGRHTTVSPRAMRVPDTPDAWLVDTPGVRSFGIAHVEPEQLWWAFPELHDLDCELPGCLHDGEPGCDAERRVGETVHPVRLESYRRFLDALRGGGPGRE